MAEVLMIFECKTGSIGERVLWVCSTKSEDLVSGTGRCGENFPITLLTTTVLLVVNMGD